MKSFGRLILYFFIGLILFVILDAIVGGSGFIVLGGICLAIYLSKKPNKSPLEFCTQFLCSSLAFILINPIFTEHWFHVFMPQIHPATQLMSYKFILILVSVWYETHRKVSATSSRCTLKNYPAMKFF